MKLNQSILTAALIVVFLATTAENARGITTTWTVFTGDWSLAANWSDGEPTSTDDVIIPSGLAAVTQDGETCASLQVGQGGEAGGQQITTGALDVLGGLFVGEAFPASSGSYSQTGGTVTAESVDLTFNGDLAVIHVQLSKLGLRRFRSTER